MKIRNAKIKSVNFDTERGLSAWLQLDYGCGGQGFGGYSLYAPKGWGAHKCPNVCGHFIYRCLEVAEVNDWNKLIGKTIRVKINGDDRIEAIGHIINDDWFNPKEEFAELRK